MEKITDENQRERAAFFAHEIKILLRCSRPMSSLSSRIITEKIKKVL